MRKAINLLYQSDSVNSSPNILRMKATEVTTQEEAPPASEETPLLPPQKQNFTWNPRELVNWLIQIVPSKALVGFHMSFTVEGLPGLGAQLASDAILRDFDKVWLRKTES